MPPYLRRDRGKVVTTAKVGTPRVGMHLATHGPRNASAGIRMHDIPRRREEREKKSEMPSEVYAGESNLRGLSR